MPTADRSAPPDVPPVEIDGVRYEQVLGGPCGILQAVELPTGKLLWTLQVYEVTATNKARGTMPIYFAKMTRGPGHGALTIENESGYRYAVDLLERKSRLVWSPPPEKAIAIPE